MTEPVRAVDLNADLGEGLPWDEALLERITSANVGCGAHAGDWDSIRRTLAGAAARGVVVGAHPGYPDRASFGRIEHDMTPGAIAQMIVEQVERLADAARAEGATIRYLKPHGALYNQAQRSIGHAEGVVEAALRLSLPLLGQPKSSVEEISKSRDVRFVAEGFADRGYSADGRLIPRGRPGAMLDDPGEVRGQVLRLVDLGIQTLCLHGDEPDSVARADRLRRLLAEAGVAIRPFLG